MCQPCRFCPGPRSSARPFRGLRHGPRAVGQRIFTILTSAFDPLQTLAISAKKLVGMQFGRLRAARRSVAWHAVPACLIVVACTSGCSNEAREIPTDEVRPGGTYLVAGLRNERAPQVQGQGPAVASNMMASGNIIVSDAVTPPGVNREMTLRSFEFVRADDNGCIGADTIAFEFPEPGAGPRYVAFALPAATYTARGMLRAHDTQAPTFAVRASQASYLGDMTLEPNGDISISLNLAEAQRHVRARLQPLAVGYAAPLPTKICTP
jgi:hypothetical protein